MIERARGPALVVTTRIGRTISGRRTLVMDDDVLTVVVRTTDGDRPVRVRFSSIDGVVLDGTSVTLTIRDGTHDDARRRRRRDLRDDLLARCRTLPELTRTLRAFGSRRGAESAARATRRAAAFLRAAHRTRAAQAGQAQSANDAIAAFDGSTLARALDADAPQFANERHAEVGPARRALEAALVDACEPLRDSIDQLRRAGEDARASVDDLSVWRAWAAQLRATFEVADRVWISVDAALGGTPWQ